MQTLKSVKPGQTVKVVRLGGEGALRRRIMDMGITKGTSVYVRKVAPLGDPVEVTVRGYEHPKRRRREHPGGVTGRSEAALCI